MTLNLQHPPYVPYHDDHLPTGPHIPGPRAPNPLHLSRTALPERSNSDVRVSEASQLDEAVIAEAHYLHDLGLSVLPIPRVTQGTRKPPYGDFRSLLTCRVARRHLDELFRGSNIAVLPGRQSEGLFVLDCDSSTRFDAVGQELRSRHIDAWIARSDRGGHYWVRCADATVQSSHPEPDLQIIAEGSYVVAPPSVHPTGVLYTWGARTASLPRAVALAELGFIDVTATHERPSGELPPVAKQVLIERNAITYGGDHSAAEFAAALSLVGAGYSDDDIVALFAQYRPPHYAGKRNPDAWFRRYVLREARQRNTASGKRRPPPNSDKRSAATNARSWALGRAWPGRTGATDRAVYLALCDRAESERTAPFRASVREVAEIAGLTAKTVSSALKRLREENLVVSGGTDEVSGAARHLLSPQTGLSNAPESTSSEMAGSDAFHHSALGKSAQMVWAALREHGPLAVAEIASMTGRGRQTVGRALDKMNRFGLTQKVGALYEAFDVDTPGLDWIARTLGSDGAAERRKRAYLTERSEWVTANILNQKLRWERRHSTLLRNQENLPRAA